jgi:hypothetical protein
MQYFAYSFEWLTFGCALRADAFSLVDVDQLRNERGTSTLSCQTA